MVDISEIKRRIAILESKKPLKNPNNIYLGDVY